jgi:hypothetical protein
VNGCLNILSRIAFISSRPYIIALYLANFVMDCIEVLSTVPNSSLLYILHGIPLNEYKNIRLVCKLFDEVVTTKIEQLEKKCDQQIDLLRQKIINRAFNTEIPRIMNKPSYIWMCWGALQKEILPNTIFEYGFDQAEELWLNLHDVLPRTKHLFCFYCMKTGPRDEFYTLPWKGIEDHAKCFNWMNDNKPPKAHYVMMHSLHHNCFLHWKQWLADHGMPRALDCQRFCPRCCTWSKELQKFCHESRSLNHYFCPSCGEWHKDRKESWNYLCFTLCNAELGLLCNRFYIEPGKYSQETKIFVFSAGKSPTILEERISEESANDEESEASDISNDSIISDEEHENEEESGDSDFGLENEIQIVGYVSDDDSEDSASSDEDGIKQLLGLK